MTALTHDELHLVISDAVNSMPNRLKRGEIASVLASIAASYAEDDAEAVMHLQTAALIIMQPESPE